MKNKINLIQDYKTAITYLEELREFSLTVPNSELLDLTPRARKCVEREPFSNKKQKTPPNLGNK